MEHGPGRPAGSVPDLSSAQSSLGPLVDAVLQPEFYTITEKGRGGQLELVSGLFFFPL